MVYRTTKRMKTQRTKTTVSNNIQQPSALPTLKDHLNELKGRFFWVVIFFLLFSAATYPFYQTIIHWLVKPLGSEKLYFMTPAGGISFIMKVCMYVGFICVLPILVYHLYKFVAPVIAKTRLRTVLGYATASTLLALMGIGLAYYVSLPAALHFLTGITLTNVSAMITLDAYMSFITTYLLAGALLFQLPLIMLIINSVTPLKPSKLMSYQRHNIVISFILAALITPTPDLFNQTIIAAPMIIMYQVGIVLIWAKQQRAKKRSKPATQPVEQKVAAEVAAPVPHVAPSYVTSGQSVLQQADFNAPDPMPVPAVVQRPQPAAVVPPKPMRRSVDGVVRPQPIRRTVSSPQRAAVRRPVYVQRRSVDGFFTPAPNLGT